MTRKFQIIISASAATVLAYSALAQDTSNLKTGGPIYARDHEQCLNRLNGAAKASHFIGMAVRNNQNEKLGKVEDFAVDVQSGRIVQVILSSGGFIGVGNKLTAVPSQALHCDVAHKVLRLDADKDKLKGGPKFEMSKWAEYSDSNHLAEVYGYYDEQPAFRFIQSGDAIADGQRNADALPNMVLTRKPAGKWDKDRLAQGSQCMIPESRLGQVQKASKLMGTPVKNKQDENLGKVENLLVDLPAGRVVAIIISSGGFLGIDDELSAVPPTALRFSAARDALQLDASKETLSNAPHFKANQWPDFSQASYVGGVYQAYNVEPYFTTNTSTEADNTARNIRDRDDKTLTPLDQGSSQADIDTTAQIRKEIIADKNMSMDAKNVKIITIDGRVTLRGPVDTVEEKRLIGAIAVRIAPSGKVDNQLEVKLTASNN